MDNQICLARVVGHLMGGGNVTRRYLRYNNKNKFLLENFKNNMASIFPNIHFIEGAVNSGTSFVQVQNKKLIEYLLGLCKNFKSGNLKFPKFLKTREMKKEFISAIFDDEGCVALRAFRRTEEIKRNLEIASKSKEFMQEIKLILEEDFDIKCNRIISFKSHIGGKEFITYKLSVTEKKILLNLKIK